MPSNGSEITVAGFGGGALDVILPPGDIGAGHIPGAKTPWTAGDQERLDGLSNIPGHEQFLHVGGNVINVLVYLALQKGVAESRFIGVLGEDDPVSNAIRTEILRFSVTDCSVRVPGHNPSISLVERMAKPGSDRMVRGRPRDPMDGHLSDEHIRLALAGVQVAVISSSKIPRLTRSVFELAPDSTMLSYNPGSSEFSPGSDVLPLMQDRQPDLFTANEEELRALFADADTRIEDITLLVAKYARTVICTLGKAGLLLAHNGQVSRQECTDIPKKRIKDTLGAGDRVHAVAIYRHLIRGDDPRVVLQEIDNGATQVVQRIGAHGDLYSQVQPVTFSLK